MSVRGRGGRARGRGTINMTEAELATLINDSVAEALAAQNAAGQQNQQPACTFKAFMDCKPHAFSGAEGVVGLLRWFEKVESVIAMCNCPMANQVKFAAGTLEGLALTWWNAQQQQQRRFEPTKNFNQSTSSGQNQGGYAGNSLQCNKCNFHHFGFCNRCQMCGKIGHATKDCRGELQAKQPFKQTGSTRGCFEYGKEGHIRKNCPQLKKGGNGNHNPNQNNNSNGGNNGNGGGNGAKGRAFVLGSGEARYDHNVVTGKFLLNNYFASVLFDTGADRSFISKKLSDMIKRTQTLLEAKYIIEIADG
ncbi:hypothetical protein L1987_13267 [Smallanthus sonchifolius]|uniref:Uncharacterized protein n=1 Tax=Smallanthus sonchifolius TaxID=185202 RepID=A0ACB9JJJ3_9ASTR|nr:hypothetical protein L1987_13267 [Smallanthus sonchifolius]